MYLRPIVLWEDEIKQCKTIDKILSESHAMQGWQKNILGRNQKKYSWEVEGQKN